MPLELKITAVIAGGLIVVFLLQKVAEMIRKNRGDDDV